MHSSMCDPQQRGTLANAVKYNMLSLQRIFDLMAKVNSCSKNFLQFLSHTVWQAFDAKKIPEKREFR